MHTILETILEVGSVPPKILENLEAYLYPQTFYLRKKKAE